MILLFPASSGYFQLVFCFLLFVLFYIVCNIVSYFLLFYLNFRVFWQRFSSFLFETVEIFIPRFRLVVLFLLDGIGLRR